MKSLPNYLRTHRKRIALTQEEAGFLNGNMNRSILETNGAILLISQFTLYASTRKGNRPSYSRSARPEIAFPLYQTFIRKLSEDLGKQIQTGEFGADMKVTLTNDGPVTIIMDSKIRE